MDQSVKICETLRYIQDELRLYLSKVVIKMMTSIFIPFWYSLVHPLRDRRKRSNGQEKIKKEIINN